MGSPTRGLPVTKLTDRYLRTLAPETGAKDRLVFDTECRGLGVRATAASDLFSAGVVLLEVARAPAPLPEAFDRIDASFETASFVPSDLDEPWRSTLQRLLSSDPDDRRW